MKIIKRISIGVLILVTITLLTLTIFLLNGYGFSSEGVRKNSGFTSSNEVIKTEDYDFYYLNMNGENNDANAVIMSVQAIEKTGILYRVEKNDNKKIVTYENGEYAGILLSFQGKNSYHNWLIRVPATDKEWGFNEMSIDGAQVAAQLNSYFVTEKEVETFLINGVKLQIENENVA